MNGKAGFSRDMHASYNTKKRLRTGRSHKAPRLARRGGHTCARIPFYALISVTPGGQELLMLPSSDIRFQMRACLMRRTGLAPTEHSSSHTKPRLVSPTPACASATTAAPARPNGP